MIAFELAVGGTDVPMVAFLCLGFALLWRDQLDQPVLAGLAFGIASSMKATAWPALVIAIALVWVRDGERMVRRFTAVADRRDRRERRPVRRGQARFAGEEHHRVPAWPGQRQVRRGRPLPGHVTRSDRPGAATRSSW